MKPRFEALVHALKLAGVTALLAATALAQAGGQTAPPSTKGAVIKGKAPVSKEVLKVNLPKPYETKLKNGMQVLVLENHKLPTFSMQMVILGGGLADPANAIGAASYTAAQLREGTKTRDSRQIAEQVDALGASLGANSGLTSLTTNVSASGLVDNFDPIMELFADVILNPSFPAEEFNKYKTRQLAAIRTQRTSPGFLAGEKFAQVIYGSHPAGRYALTAEQIQKLTPETLKQYHATHFKPNNAIFAIVGDVKPAEVIAKLEKAFANWQPGDVPKTNIPETSGVGASKIYLIDRPNSVQTSLVLGGPSIKRTDPDYFALEMMNQVLGGFASARLFLNLREDKGYTYGAYSGVSSYKYRGTFRASSDVRSEVTGPALKEFMYEFKRIREEQVPATEFERSKRSIVGGWAMQLESPQSVLSNWVTSKIYELPADYWDTYPQKIAAVTPEDIQRVAQKYLDLDKLQIVAVGDAKKIAEELKTFGPVEMFDTEGKPLSATAPAVSGASGSAAGASPTAVPSAALAGNWTLTVDSPQGQVELKAVIKLNGAEIGGTLDTPFGQFPITGGAVNGQAVTMKVKADMQGTPVELQVNGKLDGATLNGQLNAPGFPAMEFKGKKEK
jgi:zinc protease